MGANAQTTVPKYTALTVLPAASMNISAGTGIPVFDSTVTRDAAFGGVNKVLAEGQTCYLEDANVVQYYDGAAWASLGPTFTNNVVATSQTTTSTSYTDLATSGPAVTVTTGTTVYVILTCYQFNNISGSVSFMGVAVTGATTIAASDTECVSARGAVAGGQDFQMSAVYKMTVTAGSNTFTAKYRVTANTGTFQRRGLTVIST